MKTYHPKSLALALLSALLLITCGEGGIFCSDDTDLIERVRRYRELLSDVDEILPLAVPSYPIRHAWHLFVVSLDTERAGIDRDTFMAELKKRNIGTGIHFKAVHTQKYYREKLRLLEGALPATEWNLKRICSLPLFPNMALENVDSVVATIKGVLA
ncbi:MAG: DegT/DnrJ/EryC1/StrS family aminotransferase [Desulfobacteraceae bacterium]|nr:DegT/DnrJ/EryC1/StrS family aminotransferase [Desulfobacteraceae bacterium]